MLAHYFIVLTPIDKQIIDRISIQCKLSVIVICDYPDEVIVIENLGE